MDMEIISNAPYQDMAITQQQPQQQEQNENKKPRPHPEQALPCPRCESTNTKFCYYNNYSLSQPRYFCKACRRYWTRGGSLRSVPVGGGCRKNHHKMKTKKPSSASTSPSSSSSSSSSSSKQTLELDLITPNINININPLLPFSFDHIDMNNFMLPYTNPSANPTGFLDTLRGSGHVENSMQSLYYDQMFPIVDGGLLNSAKVGTNINSASTTTATMVAMDQEGDNEVVDNVNVEQWGQLIGGDHGSNLGMDSVRDQYWNNNSNGWHGLINSSLM